MSKDNLISKITASVQKLSTDIQSAKDRRAQATNDRTRAKIARDTESLKLEQEKTDLEISKLNLQTSLYRKKAVVKQSQVALDKAKREAGDIPLNEKIAKGIADTGKYVREQVGYVQSITGSGKPERAKPGEGKGTGTGKRKSKRVADNPGKPKSEEQSINDMLWK